MSNKLGNKQYTRLYRDWIVLINDKPEVELVSEGRSYKRDINEDVTSISVNYNIDAPPATCDIEIQAPRHKSQGEPLPYRDGSKVQIKDFDEIKVYARNRFKYPGGKTEFSEIFRGIVIRIVDSGEGSNHRITLNCVDMLYWWKIMRMNINPSLINRLTYSFRTKNDAKKTIYGDRNPYEIISYISKIYKIDFAGDNTKYVPRTQAQAFAADTNASNIMKVWEERFKKVERRLAFYGLAGATDSDESKTNKYDKKAKRDSDAKRNSKRHRSSSADSVSQIDGTDQFKTVTIDIDKNSLTKFKPFEQIFIPSAFQDEYKTRLEIAQELARICGYEFFQDTGGYITFKPPFYNVKIDRSAAPVYVVEEPDLISADFSSNSEEVVTEMSVKGVYSTQYASSLDEGVRAFYRDGYMASQYGIQTQNMEVAWIRSSTQALQYAVSELDKINSYRFQASLSITGRPELRLGMPIYIVSHDAYWYITGIAHNLSGDSFTTTITATAKRDKFVHEGQEMKNAVLKSDTSGIDPNNDSRIKTHVVQSVNGKISSGRVSTVTVSKDSIELPVSDELGYELTGGFPYGRSFTVSGDGSLTDSSGNSISPLSVAEVKTNYEVKNKTTSTQDQNTATQQVQSVAPNLDDFKHMG